MVGSVLLFGVVYQIIHEAVVDYTSAADGSSQIEIDCLHWLCFEDKASRTPDAHWFNSSTIAAKHAGEQ